jgi:hypothetical protein
MPIAIALILLVILLAVVLIGVIWSLFLLTPFYAVAGIAVYFLWRGDRNRKNMDALTEREAEKQRLYNEQEMNAWRAVVEKDHRDALKRDRLTRSIKKSRDLPKE